MAPAAAREPTVAELKARLKAVGLPTTGEKGVLAARLRMHSIGEDRKVDGVNPTQLGISALRKVVAARGLSCIGTQDEMLQLLLASPADGPSGAPVDAAEAPGDGRTAPPPPHLVAQRVLALAEEGDHEGVLSVLGAPITRASSVGTMRKAYLQLSLLVHPDKLGASFEGANKAFQAVVAAFEHLSRPEPPKEGGKAVGPAISRSNENCFVTGVTCPRCRVAWGQKVEGNPDYFYTILMMGLKGFTCSTCLLQFGCMTALHRCPFCRGCFEYHPDDYHRQLTCSRPKCGKAFGFWLHHIPERALKELKAEIKTTQEQRLRADESRRRRAHSATRRGLGPDAASSSSAPSQERLFALGLRDACPRCGQTLEGRLDDDAQRRHLMECADTEKIARHRQQVERAAAATAAQAEKEAKQEEVSAAAAWGFLGGGDSRHLWILSKEQLAAQCSKEGLPAQGAPETLIGRLAAHRKDQRFLPEADGQDAVPEVTAATLPDNLHALTEAKLRAVCAAHNIDPTALKGKKALIRALEAAQFAAAGLAGPSVPLLAAPADRKRILNTPSASSASPSASKGKRRMEATDDSDDDDLPVRRRPRRPPQPLDEDDDDDS